MSKYIALLRGIMPMNPNMRNEKLRGVFESLGFANVQTVIASGNVLFESMSKSAKALEAKIEKALPLQLGFTSTTIVRSLEQLQTLIDADPFKGKKHAPTAYLIVTFFKKGGEQCDIIDVTGASKTPDFMRQLEKQFGKEITTRTWKTVHRILNKMGK